ncbi:Gfo/Idh/MocA family oxidoreductase [Alphaproteobacteria bacterium GH1-50]|uniref:Gfo/Idh/MocA family oxidoreductase n=1 Tax=Kangsaoukella pontilimi TaxID=2691042 RepID=A0A7C9IRM3_9RHOB|nr:Gfo/Idh/MocA family oxidoreductase [Kangsaoukella pontilimi]MXQ08903.1 Gfo/Idh/MocA family oxidoreductase [Kangsaoukella pontilimi]
MRLLILGTGNMAGTHAQAFSAIDGVDVVACADIDEGRARAFADRFDIPEAYGSLDAALAKGGCTAMANTTPDAAHFATTMKAIDAGLHIFCEKPLATNAEDARRMVRAADAAGRITGVNLTYRNVAALQEARRIVAAGRIGAARHFEAAYLQSWLTQPAWGDWATEDVWLWRLSSAHGSLGALGDIGIHIFDFATYAAGSNILDMHSNLTTFPKAPGDRIGEYVLDANDSFTMTARLENGAAGVIHATRFAPGHLNDLSLRLFGTKGGIELTNSGPLGTLRICEGDDLSTATWRDVPLEPVETNYQRFADAVRKGTPMKPDFATAARLQEVIDRAAAAGG